MLLFVQRLVFATLPILLLAFLSPSFATNIVPIVTSLLLDEDSVQEFSPGLETEVSTVQILPNGTEVTFDSNSPLSDLRITFTEGAVDQSLAVSFGTNSGRLLNLQYGQQAPLVLSINVPEGKEEFNGLVEISAHFEGDRIPIPIYIDDENQIHLLSVVDVDWVNNRFSFVTSHASWYSWIFPPADIPEEFIADFEVGEDSFFIKNSRSLHNPGGQCTGMATFSKWYFDNVKQPGSGLYNEFRLNISSDQNERKLVQDVIASRAHVSTSTAFFESDKPIINSTLKLSFEERYIGIKDGLNAGGAPVVLFLGDTSLSLTQLKPVYHAVVAYGYTESTDPYEIYVYDPNLVDQSATIKFDPTDNKFEPFTPTEGSWTFDMVILYGEGTANVDEKFRNILEDANENFNGSNKATVNIQSHVNGQTVDSNNVTISGTVTSGEALITEVGIIVGSDVIQQTQPLVNGAFQFSIDLNEGDNQITFITRGTRTRNVDGVVVTTKFDTPNSLDEVSFNLIGDPLYIRDNDLNVIHDNQTGLIWLDNTGRNAAVKYNIAKNACSNLNIDSFTDWRLPNIQELEALVDTNYQPTTNLPFENLESSIYFSTSRAATYRRCPTIDGHANWVINFGTGAKTQSTIYSWSAFCNVGSYSNARNYICVHTQ